VFHLSADATHQMPPASSELIGDIDADILRAMAKDRQVIAVSNEKAISARLPDYLEDAPFQGQFDSNPMFEPEPPPPRRRAPRSR
jgi:hypothetical protein